MVRKRVTWGIVLIYGITFLFMLCCILPMINVIALSFNESLDSKRGGFLLFPRVFTLENYRRAIHSQNIGRAYLITGFRTVVGMLFSVLFCSMYAFSLTKRNLIAKKFINWYTIIPMYFGAGLIPLYLVLNDMRLTNNIWVYVLPYAISPFFVIVFRTFFMGIPESIEESAKIDGAGYFRVFFSFVLPLSLPAIATIALFAGVNQWNDWFVATAFVFDNKLWPMQTLLRYVLSMAEFKETASIEAAQQFSVGLTRNDVSAESLKMAMIVLSAAPILCIYPFMQRYFITGIAVGSLKE